jgi:hypothetical protein
LAWEEIAAQIAPPETGPFRCLGEDFAGYLSRRLAIPFARAGGPAGRRFSRIYGWRVLEGRGGPAAVAMIHGNLKAGGEAVLFGYCRFPGREDLADGEKKCREQGVDIPTRLPPAGALALSRIAALLAAGPFDRYSIRKKGICYVATLYR